MVRQIVKRDGRIVEFDKQKIINAIVKAMEHAVEETNKGSLGAKIKEVDYNFADAVAEHIQNMREEQLEVEYVQNIIINKLMASQYKDVAKLYIIYRDERTKFRENDKELYEKAKKILECQDITNDNANVDQYSFSGKENRVGEELHKRYAKDRLLRREVREAFEQNYIYLHDFGKYAIGMHNCLFADMSKLLKGFETRNGDVREANSVSTAFQLYAVIFQCQSQLGFAQ